jgi:hypothetical protein
MKLQPTTAFRKLRGLLLASPGARAISTRMGILRSAEEGAATAEYAVATLAAVGFAGLLVALMRSDVVRELLTGLIRNALTVVG